MAHVIFRRPQDKSCKTKWVARNRKYKWFFWVSLTLNCVLTYLLINK